MPRTGVRQKVKSSEAAFNTAQFIVEKNTLCNRWLAKGRKAWEYIKDAVRAFKKRGFAANGYISFQRDRLQRSLAREAARRLQSHQNCLVTPRVDENFSLAK